ncbi:MAG TPA: DUF488 domain-containing protein [Actinomycetota bacterium]
MTPGDHPPATPLTTLDQGPVGDVFTIGHSTHTLPAFTTLLRRNRIEQVIDVRTLPRSRRNPQFDIDALQAALRAEGLRFTHLPEVGGLRRPVEGSVNDGWDNEAFRGYADHMGTAQFAEGLEHVGRLASRRPTALMCAEADWRRCHRRLLSDALTVRGWRVRHILPRRPDGEAGGHREPHPLTPFLVVEGGQISYPAAQGMLALGSARVPE